MSGFSFGNTGPSTSTGSGFTFGANKSTTTGFALGTPATTSAPASLFGSAPTFGASSFGAPAASQPASGLFSSPVGQTFGAPAIGTPATQATGLSFGSTSTPTGLAFATPTLGQTGSISFGNPTVTAGQTGLTFGTVAATTTAAAAPSGLTFGTPATTTQTSFPFSAGTGLTFGTATSAPTTSLTFGTPVTSTQIGLSFGAPTTTTTAAGSLTFGTPATSAAPLAFPGLATTAATPKTLGSLTFGTPTTTTTGFSLSTPATTAQNTLFSAVPSFGTGLSKSLLFTPPVTVTTSAVPITTTTATTSIGLGGVDASQTKTGLTGSSPGRADAKAVKENQIPNEIIQTIESFKNFVKSQKGLSSDIARGSAKPLHKVQEDTESLKQMLAGLTSGFQRNGALADRLKADTAKCLHHSEMAQRTHETPPGLQYDNVAPIEYFTELVAGYERDMQIFRQEIENTEKHIQSLSQPMALTPQELALAMRRLHDSFVALAGRLQTVHNSVEMQKEQYLNLRKYFLKDSTNVFEEEAKKTAGSANKPTNGVKIAPGPTPFSVLGSQHGFGLLPANTTEPKPSFPSGNPLGK